MNCSEPTPMLTDRDAAAIRTALTHNRRGYVPEWHAGGDAGAGLHAALARNLEIQGDGLNAAPLRLQLEFLDSIGANVLPAQPARAPLVFALLDTASGDATVPTGCRVGAVLPPPAPSLDGSADAAPQTAPEFFTEQQITAMRGSLAAVYSIDPQADTYADHGGAAAGAFRVFEPTLPVPHRLCLGHAELFNLAGSAEIVLAFSFGATSHERSPTAGQRPLLLDWDYLSADGWLPLELLDDGTARFTQDGTITVSKRCGPDSKVDVIAGISSCWIRATVSARTPAARVVSTATQPDAQGLVAVEVESSIELVVGDVVTIDGIQRATVRNIFGNSLRLDTLLNAAVAGVHLVLADALPPLRPEGADAEGALPQVDVIRARVGFAQTDLMIDSARLDDVSLDISKDFYPFGEQPRAYAVLYLACKNAFSRTGARVELAFVFSKIYSDYAAGTAQAPRMQAEYHSGGRWLPLGSDHEYDDGTKALTAATAPETLVGVISFVSPTGWEESEVSGEKQLWLRLRILSGDYGQPLSVTVEADPNDAANYVAKSSPSTLKPPVITGVTASYVYLTNPTALEQCLCENDFAFVDHGEDARWPRRPFVPFTPVADRVPALHLGFTARPPAALVSLLMHVIEAPPEGDPQPLAWDYWGERGWTELSVRDGTGGLRRSGLIQFVGAPDALPRDGLGGALYRIRARLKPALTSQQQAFLCGGLWLNAVWASHGRRAEREMLGTSNGNGDQTFVLPSLRVTTMPPAADPMVASAGSFEAALDRPIAGVPVQTGERLEVREWSGRGDDWRSAVGGVAAEDLRLEVDPADPTVTTAAWVRWHAQPHFYRSAAGDRHYVVERATGVFRFPGANGAIPPAGCPIVISYVTGGGVVGNVPQATLRELRSSVGFVKSVSNPLAAAGGAAAELLRATRDRGVQAIRHRDRAVAIDDYAWLACAASSEVARARALPLEGPDGRGSRGWVGIVLVPHSNDSSPIPSTQLGDTVLRHLASRVPAGIAGGLRILAPSYVAVAVHTSLRPASPDEAATVEARVRSALIRFLHPTRGAHDGHGWDFGRSVYLSDVAMLIRAVPGVAVIEALQLLAGSALCGDSVPIEPGQLVCAGELQLKIVLPSVNHALA
ncbi:putative baseplate assembly protein [Variovorax sp. YR752]|uniref:putative baseplate assembly protein n=1 Tax=Variovorax sp. YR752 TaxID=1884383 RepID=UPI003137F40C